MKYMLDTNICIYAIKNKPENVLTMIKKHQQDGLCISAITLSELEFGASKSANRDRNRAAIMRLLFILNVIPFTNQAAIEYGKIRAYLEQQGTPIGPLDMLIAGHAKAENMTLVTNNVKEFERVPNLKVENWAK